MGVVYLAEHLAINRLVAIKLLAPDRISEENWARFQAEGKAIARLDHPNVVKVYDMSTDGPDCLYYVMERLRGMSLAELIYKRGIPNLAETLEIFAQLSSGLEYAHRNGLVHRDIKPSNIILCPPEAGSTPVVKIIDFGLVKLVGDGKQLTQALTTREQIFGSPFYMSPEQWLGKPIDKRTDVYALGCTLFECLTGRPPFRGDNVMETAMMHQSHEPPRLADVSNKTDYPEDLELLVNRMLQKQPAQRHQSMAQVSLDMWRIKAGKSVRREPVFADGLLFKIDENAEKELESPDRKTKMPLVWICGLAAVGTLFAVWAAFSYLSANNQNLKTSEILIGTSVNPDNVIGRKDTSEMVHARQVYAACPPISRGIEKRGGIAYRVFQFPQVPVGLIKWGSADNKILAKGEVLIPADQRVTLELCRGAGDYARMYPSILAKIGADDIYALEVREPVNLQEDNVLIFELPLPLVQAVSKWKALRILDFYHCHLTNDTCKALNCFATMKELKLHDAVVDGQGLVQVKWLKDLELLDIKGIKNVDIVLQAIAGSKSIREINLDMTMPSVAALKSLGGCANLVQLTFKEADIDDQRLATICEFIGLRRLSLKRCNITAKSIANLAKLHALSNLDLTMVPLEAADVEKLRHMLPRCNISYKKDRPIQLGDF